MLIVKNNVSLILILFEQIFSHPEKTFGYICINKSRKNFIHQHFKFFIIMKRIYLSIVVILALATSSILQAAVIPYLPPLQSFGGTPVDLATFLPSGSNYTLEVQGTVGIQISIAGGVLTYTPTTNGVVRFSQKNGKVYVYEGNAYMTTLTPAWSTTYPVIADATAHTDANNLLQNAGFETSGTLVGGTNYNFGTPWQTNITVASSGGIRTTQATAGNVNGSWECIWRGTANSNYFSQQLAATIKPSTAYKIIINQLTGANGTALFNVGLGSTLGGLEYGYLPVLLANGKNGTWSVTLRTPASITSPVYFTFKNTSTNTSNNLTADPLTQIDYLALVEGTDPVTGITGVSSATFVDGNAYAPEGVAIDYLAGDLYDMTSYLSNPDFEAVQFDKHQAIPGWTKTGPNNSEYCTRNDGGPVLVKTGNVYFQYWSSSRPDYSISQTVTGLPNGKYRLTAAAGGGDGATGTFVYAADKQTQVTNAGADYSVDAIVIDGNLTIGFKSVSRNLSWSYADNFRLYYMGEVQDPVLNLSLTELFFDPLNLSKTFTVSGANLTENTILVAPTGVGLDKYSLTPAEVAAGAVITATFDGSTAINNGLITATCGALSKNITVNASADGGCFTPLYTTLPNIITDPYCNDLSKYAGWGSRAIETTYVYCGARSIKFTGRCGGSIDFGLSGKIQGSKTYRVKAMVSTNGTGEAKIGLSGATDANIVQVISTAAGEWLPLDFTFTTKATPTSPNMYFNSCESQTATEGYIDNWEMYELPTLNAPVNDEDNSRMLFTSVGQTLEVPVTASGFTNGFTVTSDNVKFEVQTPELPAEGGTVTVRFIGTMAGQYNGTLTIASQNPASPAPGMMKVSGAGTKLDIPMVADITTGLGNYDSNGSTVYLSGDEIIAQFNLNSTSNVEMGVYNVNGMLIESNRQMLNTGSNQMILNANLSAGVYFVKLNIDGLVITTKLVK